MCQFFAPSPFPVRPPATATAAPQFLAKQLEEENQVLSANFSQLKQAQSAFAESAACMGALAEQAEGAAPFFRGRFSCARPSPLPRLPPGKEVLVPLTSSLYVMGVLDPRERVLVDIGTSFYVGKSPADARALLAKKAALLKENTETLFKAISVKRDNLDTVQRTLELKQQQQQQQQQQPRAP